MLKSLSGFWKKEGLVMGSGRGIPFLVTLFTFLFVALSFSYTIISLIQEEIQGIFIGVAGTIFFGLVLIVEFLMRGILVWLEE